MSWREVLPPARYLPVPTKYLPDRVFVLVFVLVPVPQYSAPLLDFP